MRLLLAALTLAALAALPSTASAACDGDFFYDSQGYLWDVEAPNPAFGTFGSGGSNGPAGSPPGPRSTTDSYDHWGGLWIGEPGGANRYVSDDPTSETCSEEDDGREYVLPTKALDGLVVRRKVYVSETGLPGARFLDLLHNPNPSPRTTMLLVGDQAEDLFGSLGSDDDTEVRSSSSGDRVLTVDDRWAVTSDGSAGDANSDVSLAHVFDGRGGADRIDYASPTGALTSEDELAYGWRGVTVPPGGTVAYLSYEIQQGVASADGAAEDEAARRAALAYDALPLAHVYAAMTDAEIAAVRNWPHPRPTAAFTATGATDRAPVAFSATGSTASSVPGMCTGISYVWDIDGAGATGASVSSRLGAGTHTVKLTVTNSCGESAARTETVSVADATAPAATLKASKRRGRVRIRLRSNEAATAKVVARRKGRVVARARAALEPGVARTLSLRRKGRVALTVTIADAAGNERTLRKRI